MSKHLKKKNPPAPSSDDDDDSLTQDLPTPGAVDSVTVTTAGASIALGKDVGAAPSSSPGVDDSWRRVAEQIDSLRTVLLHLVTQVTSSAAPGWPQDVLPSGDGGSARAKYGRHYARGGAVRHYDRGGCHVVGGRHFGRGCRRAV
ncbi:unnamed protein product [Lampetra fluviatilis]